MLYSGIFDIPLLKSCNFFHINTKLHCLDLKCREQGQKTAETFMANILEFKVMQKIALKASGSTAEIMLNFK